MIESFFFIFSYLWTAKLRTLNGAKFKHIGRRCKWFPSIMQSKNCQSVSHFSLTDNRHTCIHANLYMNTDHNTCIHTLTYNLCTTFTKLLHLLLISVGLFFLLEVGNYFSYLIIHKVIFQSVFFSVFKRHQNTLHESHHSNNDSFLSNFSNEKVLSICLHL